MRTRYPIALVAAVSVLAAVVPASAQQGTGQSDPGKKRTAPPVAPGPRDALTKALERRSLTPARYALERARSVFDLEGARRRHGTVSKIEPRGVTMVMRDLFLRIPELGPADRELAHSVLARPTDGAPWDPPSAKYGNVRTQKVCRTPLSNSKAGFCVHRALKGPNRSTKNQLDATVKTMMQVWRREVGGGRFPAPKPDRSSRPHHGGNKKTDIYLANIGASGYYGYCTTDDPKADEGQLPFSFSAYCVLDNDFREFPGKPGQSRKVTAAHEFFHAIQFRMDAGEDHWMMEGTAAVIEDHVYNGINDNYQFLHASQFQFPHDPTDYTVDDPSQVAFYYRYGSWIFWRHMMENLNATKSPNIKILRALWNRADSRKNKADDYSIQAAVKVTEAKGRNFRTLFSDYGVALLLPQRFKEGSGYLAQFQAEDSIDRMPKHPAVSLSSTPGPPTGQTVALDHLTHGYVPIEKSDVGFDEGSIVDLAFDLPADPRGAAAKVVSVMETGGKQVRSVTLNASGDGTLAVPFGPEVTRVVAVLSNASTRFTNCWSYAILVSCGGQPVDNNQQFKLEVALRPPPSP